MKALAFWRTPHSFFGSFLGVVLLAAGWCWRSSVSPLELLDTGLPVAAVGMSIGRLGCFAAGCCYGAPTEVPWSVTFRSELAVAPTGVPLHPTQLYEAASWAVLAAALVVLRRRPKNRRPKGVLALVFLSGSAVSRFTIEIYRGANHPWNDLSGAQIASLIVLLCCAPLAWCGVRERRLHRSRSGGRMRR